MNEQKQFNVRGYFTKEVEDRMQSMTDEQMLGLLLELESTPFWLAILRYNQSRLHVAQDALLVTDPVKEPSLISRNQGIMIGISDLQNAVIVLKEESKKREAAINKGEEE